MNKKWFCAIFIFLIFLNAFWLVAYNKTQLSALVSSIGQIFFSIQEDFVTTIHHPENTTYHFEIGEDIILDLNASSSIDVSQWTFTLWRLCDNMILYNNIAFTPNTTFNPGRESNYLVVNATTLDSLNSSASVTFYVDVNNSSPIIQNVPATILVCETNYLSYFFNVTDADVCQNPSLSLGPSPIAPFYVAKISQIGNVTMGEIFSGTLTKSHAQTMNFTRVVYASDGGLIDARQVNITVIEINNKPLMTPIGAQTVWANETFYYGANVSDIEDGLSSDGNLKFNLTFLNNISFFDINYSYGIMNFTPNNTKIGVYNLSLCVEDNGITSIHQNISICGQDGGNLTTCINWSLTITDENKAPNITSWWPVNLTQTIDQGSSIYFNISKYDPDGTIPDTYWYIDGVLIDSFTDNVTYTFGSFGNFNFTAEITDGELNDSVTWNFTVNYVVSLPKPAQGGLVGPGRICIEKWVCEDWKDCEDLDFLYEYGLVDENTSRIIQSKCTLRSWSSANCGFQFRDCIDLNNCSTVNALPKMIQGCYFIPEPSCNDSIKNCHNGSCELLIDCGGPCPSCPTCSDNIQNQGEGGVDCGGPCPKRCPIEIPFILPKTLLYILVLIIFLIIIFIIIQIISLRKMKKILRKKMSGHKIKIEQKKKVEKHLYMLFFIF